MSNPIDAMVGTNIATLRALRGLQLSELADAAGCTPSELAGYEGGRRVPLVHLCRISRALQVSLAAIFAGPGAAAVSTETAAGPPAPEESLALLRAFTRISQRERRALLVEMAERFAEAEPDASLEH